jgi:hypothetical protein
LDKNIEELFVCCQIDNGSVRVVFRIFIEVFGDYVVLGEMSICLSMNLIVFSFVSLSAWLASPYVSVMLMSILPLSLSLMLMALLFSVSLL